MRKAELKAELDKTVKLQTYDLSLFIGQSYFVNDGALYLILQLLYYTLERLGDTEKVVSWNKSCEWYENSNFCLIFKRSCSKQKSTPFTPPNIINFCIVYELDT